jgi:hypothetical protein
MPKQSVDKQRVDRTWILSEPIRVTRTVYRKLALKRLISLRTELLGEIMRRLKEVRRNKITKKKPL